TWNVRTLYNNRALEADNTCSMMYKTYVGIQEKDEIPDQLKIKVRSKTQMRTPEEFQFIDQQ
ncbi:hypothetical protein L9F63_028021, partial [Diploptera punctata]